MWGLLIFLVSTILWMNITPGHFQTKCCTVGYLTEKEAYRGACILFCKPNYLTFFNILKLQLANLDLNK